ncbi:DUF6886 family protein [Paenibacillus sp. HB172176]|uniref:DUF6886 family protein n=1 Tax=Paenibacillus sp. HB172176 TaxID=2493690 RepID=UPI00143B73F0|nr:DUF6886 family protein [Paenibacillus sp. HB172176]
MRLYHFSEEDNITIFHPRVKENRKNMPPVVWAIDEEHQFTFYLPRNCPRIVYRRSQSVLEEDASRFFGPTTSEIVLTIENRWLSRILQYPLFRYELPASTFTLFDETAGYYISEQEVTPLQKSIIENGLEQLAAMNIDIRFTPDLHPLREKLLQSSITDFGIHRFEFAGG